MIATSTPARYGQPSNGFDPEPIAIQIEPAIVEPADFLHSLRRRGLVAALVAFPPAVLVGVVIFLMLPPTFRASALLQLSAEETSLVFEGEERADFEIFQGTQKELVQTRLVMTAALRNMTSSSVLQMERPVEWMLGNVKVETPKQTEVMKVSTTAQKEADPIEIVNAVVDAYMVEVVNRERDVRQRRLAGIEQVFSSKHTEIRRKRNELKQLAEQLGTGDAETLSVAQQLLVQELGYIRRQLIELRSKRASINSELQSLKAVLNADDSSDDTDVAVPTDAEIDAAIANDPIYNELVRDKVTTFRVQTEADSAFKSEIGSPYEKVQTQINEALGERREQLKEELVAFAPLRRKSRELNSRREADRRIQQLTAEDAVHEELENRLVADETDVMEKFKEVGNQSIDVEMMRGEIAQLDSVLASIGQQREELKVELQSRPRVEVLRKANETEPASMMKRFAFAGFAGAFAYTLPFAAIVFLDLARRRINSSKDISSKIGMDVLGKMPLVPNNVIKRIQNPANKRSQLWRQKISESVKRLSSRLLNTEGGLGHESDGRVIMVTSSVRREGKTTLATQLAVNLANSNRRVILCDFDLRRPQIHESQGLPLSPGISEALKGERDLIDVITPTSLEGLSVITAGDCCPETICALSSFGSEHLFDQLRKEADVVVVDGCPILTSADISYLCSQVDQIVFAVRRDVSRTPDLIRAVECLADHVDRIAGAVMIEKCPDSLDSQVLVTS